MLIYVCAGTMRTSPSTNTAGDPDTKGAWPESPVLDRVFSALIETVEVD
jgi:hypothetical protein